MKTRRGKVPFDSPASLPKFVHCPMCNEVTPEDDLDSEILLDGKKVKICSACTYDIGLATRLDE